MKMSMVLERVVSALIAVFCVGLILWAGVQASDALVKARIASLASAEQAIERASAPLIEQNRISARLISSVETLVDEPGLDLQFLTLRNAANVTLVSRGRLGETALDWMPLGQGRAWRSWVYRISSAQANRSVSRDGQQIGFAHFGVKWSAVVYQAGFPLLIWAAALMAGVIGLLGVILRVMAPASTDAAEKSFARPRPSEPAQGKVLKRSKDETTATDSTAFAPLSRLARRRSRKPSDSEFAPISANAHAEQAPAEVEQVQRPIDEGRSENPVQPRQEPPQPAAQSTLPRVERTPPGPVEAPVPESLRKTAPKANGNSGEESLGRGVEVPPEDKASEAQPSVPVFAAPRLEARPTLGDSTLDLRFYPIWRGSADGRKLAGAHAAIAWRAGEAELVDAATLIRLAEKEGALRAFTQWIARRLSLLHGNWRTLELATVPIVVPIPSAMLGFADAEAVWRDALRRTDRDPDDLILSLGSQESAHASLPVRRALPLAGRRAESPRECDLFWLHAEHINGDMSEWSTRLDAMDCPVLFGPVRYPEKYPDILGHERVVWFSDEEDALQSPRSFARLLMRHSIAPI